MGYEKNDDVNFKSSLVSISSIDQLLKGHELKYIETVIEVEEEHKLLEENKDDFSEYPEEIQKKATEEFPKAQGDPDYFDKPENDKEIFKPLAILSNIKNKENEVKVKTWKANYHAQVIRRLRQFRKTFIKNSVDARVNWVKRLFSK